MLNGQPGTRSWVRGRVLVSVRTLGFSALHTATVREGEVRGERKVLGGAHSRRELLMQSASNSIGIHLNPHQLVKE